MHQYYSTLLFPLFTSPHCDQKINTRQTVWTGLSALGFGANLQHYNPVIDAPVAKQWGIPSDWRLISQLVFGSPEGGAGEKAQKPVEERVKIFGKQ